MATAALTFDRWLISPEQQNFGRLKGFAETKSWSGVTTLEKAWQLITDDATLAPDQSAQLREEAALAFVRYQEAVPPKAGWLGGANAFGIGVFLFMAAILVILAGAIFEPLLARMGGAPLAGDQSLLDKLADVDTARGLITFVFTVGVISLALIIVTANVTGTDEGGRRFERSKEILTSLVAILGTILGFYFGKSDNVVGPVAAPAVIEAEMPADLDVEDGAEDGTGFIVEDPDAAEAGDTQDEPADPDADPDASDAGLF